MQESELDAFLREHTELELLLLTPGSLQEKMAKRDRATLLDQNNLKTPNLTKGDFFEVFQNDQKISKINEDKFIPPGQNIAFYVQPRYTAFPSHHHSFIELIYVYSGQHRQYINDIPITIRQGEICLLDTHTRHSIEKGGENDIIINCLIRKRFFDAALLGRLSGNNIFSRFFVKVIYHSKNYQEYIVLHSARQKRLHQLIKMLLCEYYDRDKCSDEVINSYMVILFSEMLKVYQKDVNAQMLPAFHNTRVSDIILYIQKNHQKATLASVAKKFHFHPTHLSKLLKQLTGIGFIDIIQQVKLNQAGILLKTTNLPVNMIANEVGYENVSFFYQIFKKQYGCTPAAYRKR